MRIMANSEFWNYRDGVLFCEDVDLRRIAREVGTPVYVYSYSHLIERYRELDRVWSEIDHLICFSLKSNSSRAVAAALFQQGAGVDVVSGGELRRALAAGVDREKIVFAGVGKSRVEIETALDTGILFFTVESVSELNRINEIAAGRGGTAPVALRVNPDVDPKTHTFITTGKAENKFGLDLEESVKLYHACRRMSNIEPVGVQMHIGSQIVDPEPFVRSLKKLVSLIGELKKEGIELEYVDIGGGQGVNYHNDNPAAAEDYARRLLPLLKGLDMVLIMEPGRFITANAGALLVRVEYIKKKTIKNFIVIDGAMNDIIRPVLYDAYHQIIPVEDKETEELEADVVGPICETGDCLGRDRRMPEPEEGDLLAVMSAGAYGYVMSSTYNSRPRPPEVMVRDGDFWVIRERQSYDDLVRGESLPPFLGGENGG